MIPAKTLALTFEGLATMGRVLLRPTILSDLHYVIGEPLPYRIRAITALVDHRVIGLGGIAFLRDGPAIAFVQLVPSSLSQEGARPIPEAKRYPIAFHRAGLMAMAMIRASGLDHVIATAEVDDPAAVRWLRRLEFEPADHQPIEGKVLFVWQRERDAGVASSQLLEEVLVTSRVDQVGGHGGV